MREARGQTLVLAAVTLLLLVVMACITVSVGVHVKRKLELQTVADAAAYSNAVATARAYNTVSLLNRTMLSHWVAASGIQGLIAYTSTYQAYLRGYAELVKQMKVRRELVPRRCPIASDRGTMEQPDDDQQGQQRGDGSRKGRAPPALDTVDYSLACPGLVEPRNGACDRLLGKLAADLEAAADKAYARPRNWGDLDEKAATQLRMVREEIERLSEVEGRVFADLQRVLEQQRLTRAVVERAGNLGGSATVGSGALAWREAGFSSAGFSSDGAAAKDTDHDRGLQHRRAALFAALSSRGKSFLVSGTSAPPPLIDKELCALERKYRSGRGKRLFVFDPNASASKCGPHDPNGRVDVNAYFTDDPRFDGQPNNQGQGLGWGGAVAMAWGAVGVGFERNEAQCGTGTDYRWSRLHAAVAATSDGASRYSRHWFTGHGSWRGKGDDSAHRSRMGHGGEINDEDHAIGQDHGHGILTGGYGFVFPWSGGERALAIDDAWGQPKLPVMLTRSYEERDNPWNLTVGFNFSAGSSTQLTLQSSSKQTAVSAGMAYYHRREHWREPPNFLNPFWRATLVPMNVDEPARRRHPPDSVELLRSNGDAQGAATYQALIANGYRGLR